ncbi:hypothetical protein P5673_005117 [Acropora cervicornis]|uniref:Uncharacterized protein n=1 Tax=Acropora cervicornis TaxID=6130 RepID=A0AAD9QZR1_ACRCE|nr:hypothetical protein P5673_005117 [Acropora cervicornis]
MLSLLGLDPKQFSKSRRANNSTSKDMISIGGEKKLRRHCSLFMGGGGGGTGSYYGAWDYIAANFPKELIDEFVSGYKRGK